MEKGTCLFLLAMAYVVCACNCQSSNYGDGITWKVPVSQDVTLERSTYNLNRLQFLIVGRHPQFPLKRSLVQFQTFTGCPLGKIRWAKMYLYYKYAHKASWHSVSYTPFLSHTIEVHMVNKAWRESQATSGRRYSGANWSRPYLGLGTDAEVGIVSPPVFLSTLRPEGFMEFDVTRAIRAWRAGRPNYGLLLKVVNEQENGRDLRFYSKSFRDSSKRPVIHVMCDY